MPFGRDLDYIISLTRDALLDIQDEITGQLVDSANAIVDVWEIDCEGDWIVYVKTGLVAAGAALYLLLTPSFEEILESYLAPKPGRRHGRRGQRGDRNRRPNPVGQRRLFFNPPIPDIDNAIADAIPGRQLIAGRRIGPGEYLFWKGIDVADRFAWYWLLITATEEFATTWQSEIIKSERCNTLNDGACQFTTPDRSVAFNTYMWGAADTLFNKHVQNLVVAGNGEIAMQISNAEASALIICLGYFTLEMGNQAKASSYRVGIRVTVNNHDGTITQVKESYGTIWASPNTTTTITVDVGFINETYHTAQYEFFAESIDPNGYDSFTVYGDIALATRDARLA